MGGVLLSGRGFKQLSAQRNRAVRKLVEIENAKLDNGLTAIVFSKDRPMQLFALLTSYISHVTDRAPIVVIYSASTLKYAESYREIFAELGDLLQISCVEEARSFRQTVLDVLNSVKTRNILFFVDDIVFIRDLDLKFAKEVDPFGYILSLRHGPHLKRSYTAATRQRPPQFNLSPFQPDLLSFRWFEAGNEWSDPWSVDGQVLPTAEVLVMTLVSDFNAPNSYEGALKSFNDLIGSRLGLCYRESKILNLAVNRVQDEVQNRCGELSSEYLQLQWQEGWAIDTTVFDSHIPISPHEEHSFTFVSRIELLRSLRNSHPQHQRQ